MELLHDLALGFAVAGTWQNLLCVICGVLLGMLVGVLPGIGPVAMVAMLLPAAHGLDATAALILLAGVYCGAQRGASTAAILSRGHCRAASAVTTVDGYQMARQGRAGVALSVAALGSFFAAGFAIVVIVALAPLLTELAFRFGPQEYFALMVLGLIGAVVQTSGSLLRSIAMMVLGLLLAQVSRGVGSGYLDHGFSGAQRGAGIGLAVVAIGIFTFGEIVAKMGQVDAEREVFGAKLGARWLGRRDFREAWPPVVRGSGVGALFGQLPGVGVALAALTSYRLEQQLNRQPRVAFGKGAIQGVAGPQAAASASTQTSFIPMLMLGLPLNAVLALLVGALLIHGIQPGPQVMTSRPELFWGLIASIWIGQLLLLALSLPLLRSQTRLRTRPYRFLYPAITLICCVGVYSIGGASVDVYLTALFALFGYAFHKLGCDPAPLLLGFVLGPMMEEDLRQALLLAQGDWSSFVTRPLSAGLLAAAALLLMVVALPSVRRKRSAAFDDDDEG
ncbi:MAG: tripartite tricarboxylate transporter permease [Pseudomonadota bacterium]|nr:tripartite tricarboxylate transporter permease [Pseudomonadota bacterium]